MINYSLSFLKQGNKATTPQFIDDGFNNYEIDGILKDLEKIEYSEASIFTEGEVISDEETRTSRVKWIPQQPPFIQLYDKLSKLIERSNQNLWGFELGSTIEQIQYTEYHAEDKGHYDWHLDIGNDHYSLRKISLTVQLSDPNDYEGGILELNHSGDDSSISAPKTKGSVFIFPSYLRHRVTPVTKGVRKSLVLWVGGNQFR